MVTVRIGALAINAFDPDRLVFSLAAARERRNGPPATAAGGKVLELRAAVSGELRALAPDRKREMLEQLRAGKVLDPLTVSGLAYVQTAASNRNFVRFTPRGLQKLAWSAKGKPFLRDHDSWSIMSRGGTIVGAELDDVANGGRALRLDFEAIKPWMQEGLLDGTIDALSIGWHANDPKEPFCSVCDASMFSLDCNHWPGDVVKLRGGEERTVEMLFTDVELVETSAVVIPAVPEAGIDDVRLALSTFRDGRRAGGSPTKETIMQRFPALAALLGLSEDAEADTLLAGARKLKAEHAATLAALDEAKGALTAAQKKLGELESAGRILELDGAIAAAKREGRLTVATGADGKPAPSDLETKIRALAAIDQATALAALAALPVVVPIGKRQSAKPAAKDGGKLATAKGEVVVMSDLEKRRAKRLGIDEKHYLAAKAQAYGTDAAEPDDEEDDAAAGGEE